MNRFLLGLLVLLVAGALIGGFLVVGGPSHGRKEKMDAQRLNDLREISQILHCGTDSSKPPETLEPGDPIVFCNQTIKAGKWKDPVSGLPYEYRVLDGNGFEICARFALPDVLMNQRYLERELEFDGNRGCLVRTGGFPAVGG